MVSINRTADRSWRSDGRPGVQFAVLRLHGAEGATLITRFQSGVSGGQHAHPAGEELLVLEGECEVNGVRLRAGDYLYTPPGERHELVALTDTTVFVHLPKLPIYDDVAQKAD